MTRGGGIFLTLIQFSGGILSAPDIFEAVPHYDSISVETMSKDGRLRGRNIYLMNPVIIDTNFILATHHYVRENGTSSPQYFDTAGGMLMNTTPYNMPIMLGIYNDPLFGLLSIYNDTTDGRKVSMTFGNQYGYFRIFDNLVQFQSLLPIGMGDFEGLNNRTFISVTDTDMTSLIQANSFTWQSVGGMKGIQGIITDERMQEIIGDYDGNFNHTYLNIDNGFSNTSGFQTKGSFSIGDFEGNGNSTTFILDDFNQTISMNASVIYLGNSFLNDYSSTGLYVVSNQAEIYLNGLNGIYSNQLPISADGSGLQPNQWYKHSDGSIYQVPSGN